MRILTIVVCALLSAGYAWSQDTNTGRVLIIGIDGCRPDALRAARTPYIDGLIGEGASSFEGQTGSITVSGPGWSSALTGVWGDKHGVINNVFNVPSHFDRYPHFFHYLKEARSTAVTASIVHWAPINQYIVTNADIDITRITDEWVVQSAVLVLRNKDPEALFVHFEDVDITGHTYGFSPTSPEYIKAIQTTDGYVGQLLRTMRERKKFARENWLVILTTDHGGHSTGHGQNIPEDRTIFVIVSGAGAARGTIEPPPGVVDVAATALTHLGVPIDPAWGLDGKPVGLR